MTKKEKPVSVQLGELLDEMGMQVTFTGWKQELEVAEARVRVLEEALKGLIEAHRVIFRDNIFTAFRSGKSNFIEAWKKAEAALDRR